MSVNPLEALAQDRDGWRDRAEKAEAELMLRDDLYTGDRARAARVEVEGEALQERLNVYAALLNEAEARVAELEAKLADLNECFNVNTRMTEEAKAITARTKVELAELKSRLDKEDVI